MSRLALLAMAVAGCSGAAGPMAQAPSPMAESVRAHERIEPGPFDGRASSIDGVLPRAVEVLVPSRAAEADGVTLVVHFHGASFLAADALSRLDRPAVAAVVNLGSGSSVYERPFSEDGVFTSLLDSIRTHAGADVREVVLTSWSAGYGAVRAILRRHAGLVDGVLLLDGLHTDYVPDGVRLADGGALNSGKMEPFRSFGARALVGEAWMLVTHSAIFPGTYASTTETAAWLAASLGVEREPVLEWGPLGMQMLSRGVRGRFEVLGFAGNTAPDHVDHVHALGYFLARMLGQSR